LIGELRRRFPKADIAPAGPDFRQAMAAVVQLVEAPEQGLALPLDIRGSAFQQRVWAALRQIPAGSKTTYAEIAQRIGAPGAVRAVAGACAANALAVAIPCHRVLRSDGSLSGYRWGVERKRALLAREADGKAEAKASTASSRRRARS
jgi:AraC family transcriptional regulator of adaptative response/methylated-DNA-[protein]-cysteine methyltransferase